MAAVGKAAVTAIDYSRVMLMSLQNLLHFWEKEKSQCVRYRGCGTTVVLFLYNAEQEEAFSCQRHQS